MPGQVRFVMVKNRFPMVIAQVNAGAHHAADAVKARIAEEARQRVRVLTGETRDSIEATDDGVEAGGAAVFLEYGTRKMPAYPFMGPAVAASKNEIALQFAGIFAGLEITSRTAVPAFGGGFMARGAGGRFIGTAG